MATRFTLARLTKRTLFGSLMLLGAGAYGCSPGAPGAPGATAPVSGNGQSMSITTAQARGSIPGGDKHFTGQATIRMLFTPNGTRDFSGAYVTFQPGARTVWHSHPAGQTLVVTEGRGWVQIEGGKRRDLKPGDVVWAPPGVRHWHGATTSSSMTHLALQGVVNGSAVNWFEKVTDEQYNAQKEGE